MAAVRDPSRDPRIDTVTHARLRLAQGDVEGARRIASVLLAADPAHEGARALLAEAQDREGSAWSDLADELLDPPQAARASDLAASFRRALAGGEGTARRGEAALRSERLRTWAETVRRNRGNARVR
jgi:hypothetical protein